MAKVIKAYSVNRTTAGTTTVYTCPASTIAKVIVSGLYLYSGDTASLHIGLMSYTVNPATGSATFRINNLTKIDSGVVDIVGAAPIEIYLVAGQTITAVVTTSGTVQAQICVIEVS